jgi:hypothetical protein
MNMQPSPEGFFTPQELENTVRRALYRFDCPDAHTLGEYQLDLIAPEARMSVAAHAVQCEACTAELQTLRAFLAMPTAVPESIAERSRRVVAALFKPAPGLAYGGLRGAADTSTRLYRAEDVTVSLSSGDQPRSLLGLVIAPSAAQGVLDGCSVRLVPADGAVRTTTLDEVGNFELDEVPSGTYVLELDLIGRLIAIEQLRVD